MKKKIIVFESQLNKLFFCQQCGSIVIEKTKLTQGSMIKITTTCLNGHSNKWHSQPTVNGTAIGKLLIPAAILFTGNTFQHVADFAKYFNVQFVSAHYYSIQNSHLFSVVHHTWKAEQGKLIQQLQQLSSVGLCGDGPSDSPGHSAKYGTYTMMDETSTRIVEFNIVQVTEVSSNAMEYEGCKRTLNSLLSTNIPIRCFATDWHTTVMARMKSDYPQIKHQYDVWHLSKWVTNKLSKKAKKRDCVELMPRMQSISNQAIVSVNSQ